MRPASDVAPPDSPLALIEPEAGPARETALSLKGSPRWQAWFNELAVQSLLNKSILIELALTDYARKIGFPTQPPKR